MPPAIRQNVHQHRVDPLKSARIHLLNNVLWAITSITSLISGFAMTAFSAARLARAQSAGLYSGPAAVTLTLPAKVAQPSLAITSHRLPGC